MRYWPKEGIFKWINSFEKVNWRFTIHLKKGDLQSRIDSVVPKHYQPKWHKRHAYVWLSWISRSNSHSPFVAEKSGRTIWTYEGLSCSGGLGGCEGAEWIREAAIESVKICQIALPGYPKSKVKYVSNVTKSIYTKVLTHMVTTGDM